MIEPSVKTRVPVTRRFAFATILTLAAILSQGQPASAQVVCEDNGGGGGSGAVAGTDAVACGPSADASNDEAIGIGHNVEATGDAAIAIGSDANDSGVGTRASGTGAIAIGTDADADASHAVAIGDYSDASSSGSVALGGDADGDGQGALANGTSAVAIADNSIAIGPDSIAIGTEAYASGGGVAIGAGSRNIGTDGAAFGVGADSSGARSTALGFGAASSHTDSTAIGAGATTTRANQVVLGTTSETYTLPGLTSAASAAAQSGPIEVVTTDADGNLATDGGALFASLAGAVPDLQDDVDTNRDGVALALAMQVPYVPPNQTFALSSGLGFFEDATAFSVSTAWRMNPSTQFDAGLGYGFNTDALGGRVGVTVSW